MHASANPASTPTLSYIDVARIGSMATRPALRHGSPSTGAGDGACGSSAAASGLPAAVWDKVKNHPCYSEQAHHHFARMHLAVAPACNIQCNYCNRKYDCSNESRPGVVSQKLTPEQALGKVLTVARALPQLTVLGIAGPGDALANPAKTFDTFRLLQAQVPDLKLCLSTNGLALPDWVDALCQYQVEHVTITINAVDPAIGEKIVPWIFWQHRRHRGRAAAQILLERQLLGLEMLSARGVLVKVNSVLIPGINDQHLIEVNRAVKQRGAFLHNIMPLISEAAHGTAFGLAGQRGPSAAELKAVQDACLGGVKLMRHCRQCRADAVGLLGQDRSDEFTQDKLAPAAVTEAGAGSARRLAHQGHVEFERAARQNAWQQALAAASAVPLADALTLRVAVATQGGGRINQHFGHATEFQVFEVSATQVQLLGHRRVDHYCQGGYAEDEQLPTVLRAINDCHAVLVAKVGACPRVELAQAGIEPVDQYAGAFIEAAALTWFADYCARVAAGSVQHPARGDAELRQGAFSGIALAA